MGGGGGVSVPVHHQTTDDPLTGFGGLARAGAGAMKLCIDLCHPTKNGAPTERPPPCPAAPAKAIPAASHPTNDLPARRPLPTRPSTFSPARSCHLPTSAKRPRLPVWAAHAKATHTHKARPPAPGNPPAPSRPARRHSACATMSHLRPFDPTPTRTAQPPAKISGGYPPNPSHRMHLRCVQNESKDGFVICQ